MIAVKEYQTQTSSHIAVEDNNWKARLSERKVKHVKHYSLL